MEEQQKLKIVFSSVINENVGRKSNYSLNNFLNLKIIYLITFIIIILFQTKNILAFIIKNSQITIKIYYSLIKMIKLKVPIKTKYILLIHWITKYHIQL